MNRKFTLIVLFILTLGLSLSFDITNEQESYQAVYFHRLEKFRDQQTELLNLINKSDLKNTADVAHIQEAIAISRTALKNVDFWYRYLEPNDYRRLNGPLPVEWETEVFEKFEAPYRREGTGLIQAATFLDEGNTDKKQLAYLVNSSLDAIKVFQADSITTELKDFHHFFLCNRLYLLNLAAIYTTGFECPNPELVVPELRAMLADTRDIYYAYNNSFPTTKLPTDYLKLYNETIAFVDKQPNDYSMFDHFSFIRNYINPLFTQNQTLINKYKVHSRSMVDYSLNKTAPSIFDKDLYNGQNAKGIFHRVKDPEVLKEIDRLGKLLFYDPILSANNQRSCASCHKPTEFFTDTLVATAPQFDRAGALPRNTPSLVNVQYNHLIMMDGKHISLQNQTIDVVTNAIEMGSIEAEAVARIMSCNDYKKAFTKLLEYTPTEKEVNIAHIASALTFYYAKFSKYYSPFDEAMNQQADVDDAVKHGFNIFMSKAQCATCHFVPQFNGVKPPYVGSEFEVLGVPEDTNYSQLSADNGRHDVHKADEMLHAFRTGSIRNSDYTKPYMHNGVFNTMEQVIDFYDAGGGVGHGLDVPNQTLPTDSLKLTIVEKKDLMKFISSLNEKITFEDPPKELPKSKNKNLNNRVVGGVY